MALPLLNRRQRRAANRGGNPARVSARHDKFKAERVRVEQELPGSMTAGGEQIRHGQATYLRRLIMPWQIRAFGYYDIVPEIKYAAQFYSRALANLELYVAWKNDEGEYVPVTKASAVPEAQESDTGVVVPEEDVEPPGWDEADAETALAALDRICDPGGGGRSGLLASYGRLMFLVGEALLFVSINHHTGLEQWEMLSTDELRLLDGSYTRFKAPVLPASQFRPAPDDAFEPVDDEEAVAYRLWKKHPRFSMLADATMEGVLDLCVAEGTLVNTMRGPVPVEEVTTDDHVFTWAADGVGVRPVVRHLDRGEQPVMKVTAGRRTIRATAEHPLLVLRKDTPGKGHHARYECEWVEAGSLEPGDHLVSLEATPDYGVIPEMPDGTPVSEDVAWLLGQIVGDGHVHAEGVNIAVYNEARAERIRAIVRANWGLEDHPQGGNVRFYSRSLRRSLERMGLRVKSHRKRVPAEILSAPPSLKRAFLAGYEEADGHLTKQGWQSLALSSRDLANQLRALYIELGENVSNIHVEERAAVMTMPGGYTTENARPLHRFQVYYGSRRRGALNVLKTAAARAAIGGNHFTLATVKSVVPDGVARTYDLEVEGEHNYIADGLVSHNCEELVLLTQAVRARARSRLAGSGILFLDDRITSKPAEPTPDEDPLEDPFVEDLTEAMTTPITDEGTASAVVPLVARVRVPDGMKLSDLVYHLQIVDPTQLYPETGLRMECIKRLAIGLDMPPEILLGLQDSNHWSAWQIDEQVWKAHLQPVANQLIQDLTSAYLGPYLKEQGVVDWQRYAIQYDASAIINHPDRTKDAKELFQLNVIGKPALRREAGFDEADAPTLDESAERIGILTHDSSLAWDGTPAPRGGAVEVAPGVISSPAAGSETAQTGPATGGEVDVGPPPGGPPPPPEPASVIGSVLPAMIEGAAQLALLRAREAAGSRLRTAAARARRGSQHRDNEMVDLIDGVAARDVAAVLGRVRVRELLHSMGGGSENELVAGTHDLIVDALRLFGVEDESVAAVIAETIQKHAVRTIYDRRPTPLPPNFSGFVAGLLAASNGHLTPA